MMCVVGLKMFCKIVFLFIKKGWMFKNFNVVNINRVNPSNI